MFKQFHSTLLLAGFLALAACSAQKEKDHEVSMKGVPVYRVPAGGKVVAVDAMNTFDVNHYDRLFNHHPSINQPIYRLIEAKGFSVYIGLVLDKEIQGPVPDLFEGDSAWQLKELRVRDWGKIGLLKNDSLYDVRFIGHSDKTDMTHLINLKTRDSSLAASYFYSDSLFKGDYLL
jgi:hypothetical protein